VRCSRCSNEDRFLIPGDPCKNFMKNPPKLWVGLGAFFETLLCEQANRKELARRLLKQHQEQQQVRQVCAHKQDR
jgi:hypothetical protein